MINRLASFFICALLAGCVGMPPPQVMAVSADDIAPDDDRTIIVIGEAQGQAKDELFANARQWLAASFRSSKAVIDLEDKAEGIIMGNGTMPYPKTDCEGLYCGILASWQIRFKIKIEIKDSRYRMSFTDLELYVPPSYGQFAMPATQRPLMYKKELATIKADLNTLASSLATYSAKAKADKNW